LCLYSDRQCRSRAGPASPAASTTTITPAAGLMAGAVFGRIARGIAAAQAKT